VIGQEGGSAGEESGGGSKREKNWEGAEGRVVCKKRKKSVEWAHVVVVCMEYEIQGMTGAEKTILYCRISMTEQNILL
jgi:hypothetical protein